MISGETTIAFASEKLANSNFKEGFQKLNTSQKPFGIELAFTSENIDVDFNKALQAGATLWEAVKEKPWGQKVGYLRDLNGMLIEICTPMH